MKDSRPSILFLALAFSSFLLAAGASAQQSVLLVVIISSPAQVTITATSNGPLVTDMNHPFSEGIDLLNFFRGNVSSTYAANVLGIPQVGREQGRIALLQSRYR